MEVENVSVAVAVTSTPKFTKFRILKNLVVISSTFLMLFTAYDGLSMLQSTMNKEGNIGTISQAVVYAGFCICSLLLPKYVIKKLGCKITILIASVLFIPYIAANFYPTFLTMMPSAFLLGLASSLLWGAQCTYFNESALLYCTLTARDEVRKSHPQTPAISNQTSTEVLSVIDSVEDLTNRNSNTASVEEISARNSNSPNSERLSAENLATSYKHYYENSEDLTSTPQMKMKYKGEVMSEKRDAQERRNSYSVNNRFRVRAVSKDQGVDMKREPYGFRIPTTQINPSPEITIDTIVSVISSRQNRESYYKNPRKSTGYIDALQKFAGLESITARFFGFHGLVFHSAQVWSNVVSYYILHGETQSNITVNSTCFCGAEFCNLQSDCLGVSSGGTNEDLRYLLTGVSVILAAIGVLLVLLFLDPLHTVKEPVKFSLKILLATLNNCRKTEQLAIIAISFYVGMIQGFYTADFTKSFIGCAWGSSNVGIVTVFYGLACALSATLSGFLVKYVGRIPILLLSQIINIGVNVFLLLWTPDPNHQYLFFLSAGMCGIVTGILWAQLPAFYGVLFKKDEEAAFGCYYVCSSMGWLIPFAISDYICTNVKIYILLAVSSCGILGYLLAERIYTVRKNQISLRFA
ncbi:UNC93-like protein [Trichonephila clavata]|uniref:UNC93-like protein n=1 Tax=Trichonephila clavata TaxID=2740835 RepID=A0A8X6FN12_TRICU|nr:UNC93-like protein [Trichonephila clavata]